MYEASWLVVMFLISEFLILKLHLHWCGRNIWSCAEQFWAEMWQPQEQEISSLTYRQGHRVTGCRLEWGMAEIFGIFMLCKITPTCCFEHCVCQAPERRLSIFVCYHLLVCYQKKSLSSLSSHPRISDKILFYGLNNFKIAPSSIPRGSRRVLVRIGKTRHIEPRSHVMVEPEDIWPLLCSPLCTKSFDKN